MKAAAVAHSSVDQGQLRDALIAHCRLSREQVDQVQEAMRALHLKFAEAAVQVGIVTQNELNQTIEYVSYIAAERELSVTELAINRHKPSRDIIVRPRQMVTPSKEVVLAHDPYNPRTERVRALRTELLLLDNTPSQTNVLALVSPCSGEGRSLLAAELAIAFSQLRRRTLLIDADFRHPRQHVLFESQNASGLAQALESGGRPELLGVNGVPECALMTTGPTKSDPLELLSDGRFERLLADWRHNFDDIVIDTPPVGEFVDGLSIATTAGRVLVLGRAAMTPHQDMKDMMRRLRGTQARIMGAVLSKF